MFKLGNARLRLTLLLTLVFILVVFTGCFPGSPAIDIIIENQTDQVLTISFMGGNPLGNLAPGQQIVKSAPLDTGKYSIEARNTKGEIVFSETYTRMPDDKYHLIETNLKHEGVVKVYKAVIPPLTTTPESSGK